jgi:uncharacterized protein (TIGR02145 family)
MLIFTIVKIQAQNYQISFAGTGASATVDSVKIENLSQCTDTSIGGSNILNLTPMVTGINENTMADNVIHIYPNPISGFCSVEFNAIDGGNTTLELDNINGKKIVQVHELLSQGNHTYYLSGISTGVYILKIESDKYSYSSKIVSINAESGTAEIKHIGTNPITNKQDTLIGGKISGLENNNILSLISMQYNTGDTLKLTGKSGNYRTVVMLMPSQSQTVTFTFVNCTDADNNHYAVVQIGTQVWMEENLKTTKYRDGSSIPNVPDSATWRNTTSGAYCDYHNLPAEGAAYGHIYNFRAVADVRNMAPVGWHVASDSEWTVFTNFLGGANIAGRKLKENCNTRWAYQDTTWGNNISGFTALCANFRNTSGAWSMAPNNDHDCGFWTSTSDGTAFAWARLLRWCYGDVWIGPPMYNSGYSVRCIKD